MAYKILGQVRPANTSDADLYAVPAGSETVVSTLHITNTGADGASAHVHVRKFDGTLAAANEVNMLVNELAIAPRQQVSLTIGITLAAGDTITISSSAADTLTFHAFGNESEL